MRTNLANVAIVNVVRFFFVLACFLPLACGDDSDPVDSGGDASSDVPGDVTRDVPIPDSGPECPVSCSGNEDCCLVDGEPTCTDVIDNDDNCGGCGIQCGLEFGQGTQCVLGRCECGGVDIGCEGRELSWCCPPREAGGLEYCANFFQDTRDCGGCGMSCDLRRASRCDGSECRCGASRDQCTGEPDSVCCMGPFEIGCVDTTNDEEHCGECEERCRLTERCIDSVCTPFDGGMPLEDAGPDGGADSGT